jgi:deazaflavin-dependent oxidoreductase (nitroreductase family)
MSNETPRRYLAPTRVDRVSNATMAWLTRHGLSIRGSRVLAVRGRKSGEWRTIPVNPLTLDDSRYLVAPRGETQWVRNLRATGYTGELRIGRRVEPFVATELSDEEKTPVLRAYLKAWKFEVGRFFEGITPDSGDEELRGIAPGFPVFRISPAGPTPTDPTDPADPS